MIVAALRRLDGQRAMLGNEYIVRLDVLAARAAKAHHVPVVDDRVIVARQQEDTVVARRAVGLNDPAEHVPRAWIDAAGERPASTQAIAARDTRRLARRKHDRRGNQYSRIGIPDLVLALDRPERKHPVVYRIVRPIPGGRTAAARERRADVDQRNPWQLGAADTARLKHAHQAAIVELTHRLVGTAAQRVRNRRARLELRHHRTRTRQRLIRRERDRLALNYDFVGQWRLKQRRRPALTTFRMPGN